MPIALVRHVCTSASHSAGHALHVLFLRLKHANLPLLVAFLSALFMFLRALGGAGYTEPHSYAPPDSESLALTLNQSYIATDGPMNGHAHAGFAEHWARFKETFLACPVDISDDTDVISVGDESGMDAGSAKSRVRTPVGVGCLKERLSNVISLRGPSGPSVKKEDRAFGVSLDAIPSRRKGDALQKHSLDSRGPEQDR